jgi:hypothetical protein
MSEVDAARERLVEAMARVMYADHRKNPAIYTADWDSLAPQARTVWLNRAAAVFDALLSCGDDLLVARGMEREQRYTINDGRLVDAWVLPRRVG